MKRLGLLLAAALVAGSAALAADTPSPLGEEELYRTTPQALARIVAAQLGGDRSKLDPAQVRDREVIISRPEPEVIGVDFYYRPVALRLGLCGLPVVRVHLTHALPAGVKLQPNEIYVGVRPDGATPSMRFAVVGDLSDPRQAYAPQAVQRACDRLATPRGFFRARSAEEALAATSLLQTAVSRAGSRRPLGFRLSCVDAFSGGPCVRPRETLAGLDLKTLEFAGRDRPGRFSLVFEGGGFQVTIDGVRRPTHVRLSNTPPPVV